MIQNELFAETPTGLVPKESANLRDAGLEAVTRDDWQVTAMAALRRFAASKADGFLAEDFRAAYLASGGEPPHHHNAWGALIRAAATGGIIEPTGNMARTRSPKTHAHPTRVWREAIEK